METLSESKKNSNRNPLIIVIVILIAGLALLSWLYLSTRSKLGGMITEKENQRIELQYELDSLINVHNEMKEEYGSLSDSLSGQDSIIQANAIEIRKLLDTQYEFFKVKKKLDKLRMISQGYLHQMDSLYNVNRELRAENDQIRSSFRQEQEKSTTLQRDKEVLTEKVNQAAVLRAYKIVASPLKGSGDREKLVDKAKRVEKIKVCYTLGENPLLSSGMRNIYVRIAGPDKKILTRGVGDDYSFSYKGEIMQFSSKQVINYDNKAVDLCDYWVKRSSKDEMLPGTYVVTVYADDNEIGQTSFELK
ncbi:MAG: hypothetical protein ACM3PX_03375 [Omnitrophica WOR_2 bacterium]|jgi:hypothetical protein